MQPLSSGPSTFLPSRGATKVFVMVSKTKADRLAGLTTAAEMEVEAKKAEADAAVRVLSPLN